GLLEMRAQDRLGSASLRSGSGPSFPTISSRRVAVTSAHCVAPRWSAYDVCSPPPISRIRTWPIGAGTSVTPRCTSKPPINPRCTCTTRSASKSRKRCLPADSATSSIDPSSCMASAPKRPCGLLTRTGCPAKAAVSSVASRCRVCPSGTVLIRRRAGGQRWQVAGLLVVGQHRDPAGVALLAGEGRGQEQVDEVGHLVEGVHPAPDRDHVRIVVLPGQDRGLLAPHQSSPHALHLVRGDLLT